MSRFNDNEFVPDDDVDDYDDLDDYDELSDDDDYGDDGDDDYDDDDYDDDLEDASEDEIDFRRSPPGQQRVLGVMLKATGNTRRRPADNRRVR